MASIESILARATEVALERPGSDAEILRRVAGYLLRRAAEAEHRIKPRCMRCGCTDLWRAGWIRAATLETTGDWLGDSDIIDDQPWYCPECEEPLSDSEVSG